MRAAGPQEPCPSLADGHRSPGVGYLGLVSMRERASLAGGAIEIDDSRHAGADRPTDQRRADAVLDTRVQRS
jgi:hypothetical protein